MKNIVKLTALIFLSLTTLGGASTLSDLRTQVRANIRDNGSASTQRYSDSAINSLLNEGQRTLSNNASLDYRTTSYVLSPGTSFYALPEDFNGVYQAAFLYQNSNQVIILEERAYKKLNQDIPNWQYTNTGTPAYYATSYGTSPVVTSTGAMLISYVPVPDSTSTGTVTLWYYYDMADMNADGDLPFSGRARFQMYGEALSFYATARLMAQDGIYDESQFYFGLFTQKVKEFLGTASSLSNYSPSASGGK